eukprot:4887617-Pyramimonas_sp.AAC.1
MWATRGSRTHVRIEASAGPHCAASPRSFGHAPDMSPALCGIMSECSGEVFRLWGLPKAPD